MFNCCSCTQLKLAINELMSLHCSSMPALNISFSSSFLLLLLLSSCSFSLGSFFAAFVFSDLLFIVCFHNSINTRTGTSLSNVTECHVNSSTEYFINLLGEDGLFSISSTLVPVPIFRSLVPVYPVLHCLLAFVASFLVPHFSAQLMCDPFPHFSTILAL